MTSRPILVLIDKVRTDSCGQHWDVAALLCFAIGYHPSRRVRPLSTRGGLGATALTSLIFVNDSQLRYEAVDSEKATNF